LGRGIGRIGSQAKTLAAKGLYAYIAPGTNWVAEGDADRCDMVGGEQLLELIVKINNKLTEIAALREL